jgi:Arc/MetJ-type ribon-helix-helix transcriptional regulator
MQFSIDLPEDMAVQLQMLKNSDEFVHQAILAALAQNREKSELQTVLYEMRNQAEHHQLTEEKLAELLHD